MSLLLRRRHATEAAVRAPKADGWAARLGRIGRSLDASGLEIRSVAIAMDGGAESDGAFVTGLAWLTSRYHQRWSPVSLHVEGGVAFQLTPAGPGAPARGDAPLAVRLARRYEAVGILLDQLAMPIVAPSVVDLDDSVIITALGWGPDLAGHRRASSFGYTNAQIEAAAAAISERAQ